MAVDFGKTIPWLALMATIAGLWIKERRDNRNAARDGARERERIALAKRGALRATFGPRALTIRNDGEASARSIALTLNGVAAAETDLFRTRPVQIETIAPGGMISLPFVVWDGMPRQHDVEVTWDDESGESGSWQSGLTIP